ncbi:MAG TPA: hypothetical protein VND94_16325 [Terriglobia bacterium]|nr:hypothetical protein [Terriglobia bacterium]
MRPKQTSVLLTLALLSFAAAGPAFSAASPDARVDNARATYRTILADDHHNNDHHDNDDEDWNRRHHDNNNNGHDDDAWQSHRSHNNDNMMSDPTNHLNGEQYNHSGDGRDAYGRRKHGNSWWDDFWGH